MRNTASLIIELSGNFNHHHANWLGVGTSITNHETSVKDFCDSVGLTQSVNFLTQISSNGKILPSGSGDDKLAHKCFLLQFVHLSICL